MLFRSIFSLSSQFTVKIGSGYNQFRIFRETATEYVKLRGLGEDKKYRVEVVGMQTGGENGQRINGTPNAVEPEYYTGAQLVYAGVPVPRLGNEYKSWQVYVKEV